jgi:two-component system, LytTR family, response regulator
MTTISVIIIDDEPLARQLLKEYLSTNTSINIIAESSNGFEAVKAINTLRPDVIFLDIQMPKLNGFEVLELLEHHPLTIFTTAFNEYAIQAFEANAIDYLLKPYTADRLHTAFAKAIAQLQKPEPVTTAEATTQAPVIKEFQQPRIVIKDNHQIHIVPYTDIVYLEAADDYVKVHTLQKTYLKKHTLQKFENLLPESEFCRIHRSYIIQLANIAKVSAWHSDGGTVILKGINIELPASKAGYQKLKQVLGL